MFIRVFSLFISVIILSACSTRQVADKFQGSTEQRLVTHSINQAMSSLPDNPLSTIRGKKVNLQTHFIKKGPLLDYATARFKQEMVQRYNVIWVNKQADAEMGLDLFFTSLGTDQDSLGFTVPLPVQGQGTQPAKITLLSLEMFHGITELYLYLTDYDQHLVRKLPNTKAEVRTDKLATPVITIPISTMD